LYFRNSIIIAIAKISRFIVIPVNTQLLLIRFGIIEYRISNANNIDIIVIIEKVREPGMRNGNKLYVHVATAASIVHYQSMMHSTVQLYDVIRPLRIKCLFELT
jgi:hypothetical protein